MNARRMQLLASALLGLLTLVGTLALLGAWDRGPGMVYAQSGTGVIRVAITGTNAIACGDVVTPCRTVQYAVDQAVPGEEIRVATGVYTDISVRKGVTQVVYITKTVSLRGGYTTADWDTSDPKANPTTLDAQNRARPLYISGTIAPSIEGLNLTGGDADAAEPPRPWAPWAAVCWWWREQRPLSAIARCSPTQPPALAAACCWLQATLPSSTTPFSTTTRMTTPAEYSFTLALPSVLPATGCSLTRLTITAGDCR